MFRDFMNLLAIVLSYSIVKIFIMLIGIVAFIFLLFVAAYVALPFILIFLVLFLLGKIRFQPSFFLVLKDNKKQKKKTSKNDNIIDVDYKEIK